MQGDREERIRERARAIWEEEGRPEGKDREHWERATAEVDASEAGDDSEIQTPDLLKTTTAVR